MVDFYIIMIFNLGFIIITFIDMTREFIRVPYGQTVHGDEEIQAVVNVLHGSTQMGKNVREFESKVAQSFDKKYGIMVNSGSSALFIAMDLFNLPEGSEVITPALTFGTTASCIVKNRLVPAFVDCENPTYCIDVNKIEEMITPKTRAMVIPDLIGNICKWDEIRKIADKYNLLVLDDSADTLGGTYLGKPSGYWADICITSFYGSHVINAAGNGGMLCVNKEEYYKRGLLLRSWGRSSSVFAENSESIENRFNVELDGISYDAKFIFEEPGYNLEPSEIGAAFGLVQFNKLQDNIDKRVSWFNKHTNFLKKYEEYFILPEQTPNSRTGWLAYPIIIRDNAPFTRKDLQIFLEKRNIQTRVVFTGNINRQPGYKNIEKKVSKNGYENADQVMRGGMLLACHHGLNDEMIAHVHGSIEEFILKNK
jgi:CDP-6-deoxy-D-xylo-4-hexulose-3-dehydrase